MDTKILSKNDILTHHRRLLVDFEQDLQALKTDALNPKNAKKVYTILVLVLSDGEAELFKSTQQRVQQAVALLEQVKRTGQILPTTDKQLREQLLTAATNRATINKQYAGDVNTLVTLVERAKRKLEKRIADEEVTLKNMSKP